MLYYVGCDIYPVKSLRSSRLVIAAAVESLLQFILNFPDFPAEKLKIPQSFNSVKQFDKMNFCYSVKIFAGAATRSSFTAFSVFSVERKQKDRSQIASFEREEKLKRRSRACLVLVSKLN